MSLISFFKYIFKDARDYLRLTSFKAKWRSENQGNFTKPNTVFPIEIVRVGNKTYGDLNVLYYGNKDAQLTIGSYCSISSCVNFILDGEHNSQSFSTYPFRSKIFSPKIRESMCKGEIVVEDDVWIGFGCTILSGVRIGKGAIIAARSVVAKNVPPYSVFVNGNVLKYRFSEEIRNALIARLDYSRLSPEKLANNMEVLDTKVTEENVERIIDTVLDGE